MIPGVKDALIFVMLEDGTVHQIDLTKTMTLELLSRLGRQIKLCERAEPITWKRPEDKKSGWGQFQDSKEVQPPQPEVQPPQPEPSNLEDQYRKLDLELKKGSDNLHKKINVKIGGELDLYGK